MSIVVVGALLFSLGLYGVLTRRSIVGILASIEVMLGSALILYIGLASTFGAAAAGTSGKPEAIGVFVIVLAAAEAAVGLALLIAVAQTMKTTEIDELTEVRG